MEEHAQDDAAVEADPDADVRMLLFSLFLADNSDPSACRLHITLRA